AIALAGYSVRLSRTLRRERAALVHTNSLKAALYGGVAGRLAGVPVVWHIRDRFSSDYMPTLAATILRILALVVPSGIIVNSGSTAAALGRASRRARVIPSPIAPPVAAPRDRAAEEFVAGIVGRLTPWKGQHVFLRAFALAFQESAARAVIVGSPLFGESEFEKELWSLAHKLGIEDRVEFRGFREDVGAELARLDVVVHASTIPEPFGQVVIEGMAAGLPVIASAEGGPLEIIDNEIDGLLAPPNDPVALAARMRELAGNECLRRRLGRNASDKARRYSPGAIGPLVEAVYAALTPRRVHGASPESAT
ncbi:MAG: glycosyltransferase family 4 protein, partial [Actinomycetes bacterium]